MIMFLLNNVFRVVHLSSLNYRGWTNRHWIDSCVECSLFAVQTLKAYYSPTCM